MKSAVNSAEKLQSPISAQPPLNGTGLRIADRWSGSGIYDVAAAWQVTRMDALGLGKAIDLVRDIMTPVGGTLSEGWAALIGDRVSFWRAKNAMRYRPMLAQEAERLGVRLNPAKIPDRFAFAWFEEATKQDEPELQLLFARLLARAANEDSRVDGDRRLIDVLARFTPEDALLFQRLYSDQPFPDTGPYSDTAGLGDPRERGWPVDWLTSLLKQVHADFSELSLDHLVAVGCIARSTRLDFANSGGAISTAMPRAIEWGKELRDRIRQRDYVDATELGRALYAVVKN